jgi:hypothetical protein
MESRRLKYLVSHKTPPCPAVFFLQIPRTKTEQITGQVVKHYAIGTFPHIITELKF